jgi:hypothetical protein
LARPESADFSIAEISEAFPIRYILRNRRGGNAAEDWRRWLLQVLEIRLGEYATSLEKDREILRQYERKRGVTETLSDYRKKQAIEVRIGEKEILTQVINKLKAGS